MTKAVTEILKLEVVETRRPETEAGTGIEMIKTALHQSSSKTFIAPLQELKTRGS